MKLNIKHRGNRITISQCGGTKQCQLNKRRLNEIFEKRTLTKKWGKTKFFEGTTISIFIRPLIFFVKVNTTGVTSGAGTAYPSGAPEFTPVF